MATDPNAAAAESGGTALIADVGGTNVRFALVDLASRRCRSVRAYRCADFSSLEAAAGAYVRDVRPQEAPQRGAFCVASPVLGDDVALTNGSWRFSIEATRRALGLEALCVVNDFLANALACPHLEPSDKIRLGGPDVNGLPGFPIAALGPGTGLGAALLVPGAQGQWLPVATEGGHVTIACTTAREWAIVETLAERFGHVSAERLASGQGLQNIFQALCVLEGRPLEALPSPAEISARALAGDDPLALQTLLHFCAFLGVVAGNLALSSGAFGGVYIMGGILPRMVDFARNSAFRERFDAKGRMRTVFLEKIPTWLVVHENPAFIGLAALAA